MEILSRLSSGSVKRTTPSISCDLAEVEALAMEITIQTSLVVRLMNFRHIE